MYAWRARIGLIEPTHRGKTFAFWFKNAPPGVEIVPTFVGFRRGEAEGFLQGLGRAEQLAMELKEVGCDIIVVCGTPPFLLKGLDFERQWGKELSSRTGLPIITPMEPHAIALEALGLRKVAVATYYHDELNQAVVDYLARFGIEAHMMGGFSLAGQGEALYATPMMALDRVSFMHVYDYCKRGVRRLGRAVDAVYINGSGWDAAPAVEVLERDLGVKVVWAQAADMWLTYHKLGIHNPVSGCGSLLSGAYVPNE